MEKTCEEKGLEFLKGRIGKEAKLPEIIAAFREMCRMPMNDSEELQLLFETGSYDDNTYTVHLVRQTENPEEEEYFQITVDTTYSIEDTDDRLNKDWKNFCVLLLRQLVGI